MSLYNDYLSRKKNTAKDNEQYYKTYAQEWINKYFSDTTLVKTIKEESYPFNKEYLEYDVHIDSVSEVTVNTNKIIGNYLSLIFKDTPFSVSVIFSDFNPQKSPIVKSEILSGFA